jgi:hypothetical protein
VFDLKEEIKPQVFTLAPVGEYKHRFVFDLYPSTRRPDRRPDRKGRLVSGGPGHPPLAQAPAQAGPGRWPKSSRNRRTRAIAIRGWPRTSRACS